MLTGRMPVPKFPDRTECQGSEDAFYTQHTKYKIFPNVFLVNANGTNPSSSVTRFEEAKESTISINSGILINAKSCNLLVSKNLRVKNYVNCLYSGRIPLAFYGPKTKKGERFKLVLNLGDLDQRTFAKEEDLSYNSTSRNKTDFYSDGSER